MRALSILAVVAALAAPAYAQTKVAIDPGHGGQDPGGTGNGLQEKNIVLDVSLRFRDLLDADTADLSGGSEWQVSLTRTDDTFVSLSGRAAFANDRGVDRFISIHSNAFSDPSANGTETFSYSEGTNSANLRDRIQEELLAAWNRTNRGSKTANFAVLRETAMPAVLSELAFITNAADAQYLASPEERQKAAAAHLFGLQRHLGFDAYQPGAAPGLGSVDGVVVDPSGPVAGAQISIDGELVAQTDAAGEFSVAGLAVGARALRVDSGAHQSVDREIEVVAGQAAEIVIELLPLDDNGEPRDDDDEDLGDLEGGCSSTGRGATPGALLLFLLAVFARRSTRRAARRG